MLPQRRNNGSIEPVKENRRRKAVFDEDTLAELDALVQGQCDITLNEIMEHFGKRIECSLQTIYYNLRRLGWSYKKNRYVPRRRTGTM